MINIILKHLRSNRLDSYLLLLGAVLVLFPFYTIGYLLLCVYGARQLYFIRSLNTYFANFVLTFLILCASTMVVGVLTSYLSIPSLAIFTFATTLFFISALSYFRPSNQKNKTAQHLFDTADIASILSALLIPLVSGIMIASSIGISGWVYRLAANGSWDGVQHFSFLQVDAKNDNYIFSTSPIVINDERISNNYPQGWHLASSEIAKGIYPEVFSTETTGMKVSLLGYAMVVFIWYFLVLYLIVKFVSYKLQRTYSPLLRGILLIIASQFIAVTILEPMWTAGFVNYIGLMAFIVLGVMHAYECLMQKNGDKLLSYTLLAALVIAATGLIWVLPVAFMLTLAVLVIMTTKKLPKANKLSVVILIGGVLVPLLALVLYLRLLLGSIEGEKYLFVTPGWLSQFPTVTVGLVCITMAVLIAFKLGISLKRHTYILAAFLLPLGALYFVSYFKINDIGYYQVKLYGIVFLVLSIFTISLVLRIVEEVREASLPIFNSLIAIGFLITALGTIFILSSQNMSIEMISKKPLYTSEAEEKMIIDFAYNADSVNAQVVVLNKDMAATQINGSGLFNRRSSAISAEFISVKDLQKRPETCLVYIFFDMSGGMSPESQNKVEKYNRLSECLRLRYDLAFESTIFAPKAMKDDLSVVDLHNAIVEYY